MVSLPIVHPAAYSNPSTSNSLPSVMVNGLSVPPGLVRGSASMLSLTSLAAPGDERGAAGDAQPGEGQQDQDDVADRVLLLGRRDRHQVPCSVRTWPFWMSPGFGAVVLLIPVVVPFVGIEVSGIEDATK